MPCVGLEIMGNTLGFAEFMIYPTTCFYHFYSVILAGLFIIFTLFLYNKEREDVIKADIISSMGVSATVIMFLALIGTLITSTTSAGLTIPMIQQDIFLYIVTIWIVLSGIWFFKK